MKQLGIFGTSGFAREVNDIAVELGFRTVCIGRNQHELDTGLALGDSMLECDIGTHEGMQYIIGIGENSARKRIAQKYSSEINFINLIHPSASFGKGQHEAIATAKGIIVCAGVRFTNNIQIGDFTIFNLNATIGHDSIIGEFSNISPGANISGNVHIEKGCLIGTGASINQGSDMKPLVIGLNTIIGSGTVVVKDCEPNSVYVGIPARRIK